mmetsp:Transcript_55117/g.81781  ORF Transcript_55117/g.81781 Transcript_55117/m.81781 type:complete len:429 (+) Transcript_55117:344-1630(+)
MVKSMRRNVVLAIFAPNVFSSYNHHPIRTPETRQKKQLKSAPCSCPFCNTPKLNVRVPNKKTNMSKIAEREEDEQRTIEAKIRANTKTDSDVDSQDSALSSTPSQNSSFGSSLQKHKSLRKMSDDEAMLKIAVAADDAPSGSEDLFLSSVEERRRLEEEMKQQHLHPLARRMNREAEEASNARAAAAARAGVGSRGRLSRRIRDRSGLLGRSLRHERDWNQIVEAFETEGGEIESIDDLVVIEAAIMLSMEEAARQEAAAAAAAGRDSPQRDIISTNDQVRTGFPLLHALMARSNRDNSDEDGGDFSDDEETRGTTHFPSISTARRGGRSRGLAGDSTDLLMRGLSEEEQVAMAIAMSLRETEEESSRNNTDRDDDGNVASSAPSSEENATVGSSEILGSENTNPSLPIVVDDEESNHIDAGAGTSEE